MAGDVEKKMEGKIVEVRSIRTGQIFSTQRGDVCLKLFYAVGAPHSNVSQEDVRAADIGNGDIYELPPTELVIAGPKMYCLYQLYTENKLITPVVIHAAE